MPGRGRPESRPSPRFIIYAGSSMNPWLKDGDTLFFRPYEGRPIEPGDVVVINLSPGRRIIHRVLSLGDRSIRTRGDNNPHADPWALARGQIAGQVTTGLRAGRRFAVRGGRAGRLQAMPVRLLCRLRASLQMVLWPFYRWLSGSEILGALPLKPRVLAFRRQDGWELQLVVQGHAVGRKRPGEDWQIKPPFRLFLKESDLSGTSKGCEPGKSGKECR